MNESRDLGGVFQDLVTRSATEQARVAQRYVELLTRLGRGELFQPAVRDAYWRFVQEESGRYLQGLATLSLDYYRALFELARASGDRFFADVLGGGRGDVTAVPVGGDSPRRVELHMRAPTGGVATGSFILQNKRATDAEISFVASQFIERAGTAMTVADLEFDPARFVLRPGEDRLVVVRLPLSDLFVAGERYTATVVVQGYSELALGLEVLVSGPGDPSAASPATNLPSPARRRGQRRSRV